MEMGDLGRALRVRDAVPRGRGHVTCDAARRSATIRTCDGRVYILEAMPAEEVGTEIILKKTHTEATKRILSTKI